MHLGKIEKIPYLQLSTTSADKKSVARAGTTAAIAAWPWLWQLHGDDFLPLKVTEISRKLAEALHLFSTKKNTPSIEFSHNRTTITTEEYLYPWMSRPTKSRADWYPGEGIFELHFAEAGYIIGMYSLMALANSMYVRSDLSMWVQIHVMTENCQYDEYFHSLGQIREFVMSNTTLAEQVRISNAMVRLNNNLGRRRTRVAIEAKKRKEKVPLHILMY